MNLNLRTLYSRWVGGGGATSYVGVKSLGGVSFPNLFVYLKLKNRYPFKYTSSLKKLPFRYLNLTEGS